MFPTRQLLLSFCLAAAPALAADDLMLRYDSDQKLAHVQANVEASVLLIYGARLQTPISVGGVKIHVQPRVVVPLGDMRVGSERTLGVPEVEGAGLQAVGVQLENLTLVASSAVFFDTRDLVERSLTAQLARQSTGHDLTVDLVAPSSGYELSVDGIDVSNKTTRVWLRLVTPNPTEGVLPVLTPHQVIVALPLAIGQRVEVHLGREVRGSPVPPTYKLVKVLDVPSIE
jgi:hypothetical protein